MNNRSFTEEEITEAVVKYFTDMGKYIVAERCEIQFGTGKGRRHGIADVVIRHSDGYWVAIVECKSGSIGIKKEGEDQLKSYLSATDTRIGILAASMDSDDWKYIENLRSNQFRTIEDKFEFYNLLSKDPRSDRPDAKKISLLNQEKRELQDNISLLETDKNKLETDKVELNKNIKELQGNISLLEFEKNKSKRRYKQFIIGLICFFVLISFALIWAGISKNYLVLSPTNNEATDKTTYQVTRIIDGDTFEIIYEDQPTSVQLIGVNAPEPERSNRTGEYYSSQATKYLQDFVAGEMVYFRFDKPKFDKYGRMLAYVYRVSDDICVNLELIREGYARVELRFPFKYEELYPEYESRAKSDKKGLWRMSYR